MSLPLFFKEGKLFYGQEPPSRESITTKCGFNCQLLAVMYWSSPKGTPSCSQPQPATDNGVRDGKSNWLVAPPPSWTVPPERHVHSINQCNHSGTRTCNRSMLPNWKLRQRNCLRKGDDGRAVSCMSAGDDNSPAEIPLYRRDCTQCSARNATAAASSCRNWATRYLPNIAGAASMAACILYIKKLLLLLLQRQ